MDGITKHFEENENKKNQLDKLAISQYLSEETKRNSCGNSSP